MQKKKEHTFVPEAAQLPVAIGGGILLLLLVLWQVGIFGGGSTAQGTAALTPEATALVAGGVSEVAGVDDAGALDALVNRATILLARPREVLDEMPRLTVNPFTPLAALEPEANAEYTAAELEAARLDNITLPGMAPEEPEPIEEPDDTAWALAGFQLTATVIKANWAMAAINGEYYRRGETLEGFTIKDIREREVILEDENGEVRLMLFDQVPGIMGAATEGTNAMSAVATRPPVPRGAQ